MLGAQRDFLQEREKCRADRMHQAEVHARTRDLNDTIAGIASRGPY